jgi:threonine/homoserine/homoserine lactone efflux protein
MAGFFFALLAIFVGLIVVSIIALPGALLAILISNAMGEGIVTVIASLLAILLYISLVVTVGLKIFIGLNRDRL